MLSLDTKISDLTLGELLSAIDEHLGRETSGVKIRGINGLANYLQCSVRSAQRLKSSGKIDKAVMQSGRTVVFDERILRRLLRA